MSQDVRSPGAARWRLFGEMDALVDGLDFAPMWLPDGARFAFVDGGRDRVALVDPSTGTIVDLFDTGVLALALGTATRRPAPPGLAFESFRFAGSDRVIRFCHREVDWLYDIDKAELTRVPERRLAAEARAKPGTRQELVPQLGREPVAEVASPDGRLIATKEGPDLALRSVLDGRTSRLTDDGEELFCWSLSTGSAPLMWSPKGDRILAAKTDWRHVPTIPHVSWLGRNESVCFEPYPRAGERHETRHFGLIDVVSRRRMPIKLPLDLERYNIQPVCWLGDDDVVLHANDHGGETVLLIVADVTSGASRVVIEEPYSIARDRLRIAVAAAIRQSGALDGRFLWLSDRDGRTHLYLYDWDGTCAGQVTSGDFLVEAVVAVDAAANVAYFTARADPARPYDIHLCRIGLDGTGFAQLTHETGDHHVDIAPDLGSFLDTHSTVDRPHRIDLRDIAGNLITTVGQADISRWEEIGWTPPQEFCVKAADGVTDLYGVLFLPPDFNPAKRYPVFESIYGGPHVQAHPNSFVLGGLDTAGSQALRTAQLGFVSVVLDARGTPGRGRDFQQWVYGRMGQFEIADHIAAIRRLAETRPWMDLERVGVAGISWGGYMTLRAMLQGADFYKVGVATALVAGHDDCWGGTAVVHNLPQVSPDTYRRGDNRLIADRLVGKLLLIHGSHDKNAPFGSAMQMAHAFAYAGKPVDMLFLADMAHGAVGWEVCYVAGMRARYLVEHLRPDDVHAEDIPLKEL